MAEKNEKNTRQKQKIYFVWFIAGSIIVIIIFAFIIIGSFWDYWSQLRRMEAFYRDRALLLTQKFPQISAADPIKGEFLAKVTIFEYSDFFCTACQRLQKDLAEIEKFYGNEVKFVYKGVPLTVHPENRNSMNAAYCAHEQNQFWNYKELLFQEPLTLTRQKYLEYAQKLGMNMENFNACLEANKYNPLINQNTTEALGLQITAIPTLYVNKQKLEGFIDYNSLKRAIDREL